MMVLSPAREEVQEEGEKMVVLLPAVELPKNPRPYYGKSISVENLAPGDHIYVGPSRHSTVEIIINDINYNLEGWYEIYTDDTVYIAQPSTRIQYKTI